jgi:tRNA (guanine-N7-)-methyltransferase
MSRKKLQRFEENQQNERVIQAGKPNYQTIKGKWHSDFFKNNNPIVLELACGRGEYSIALAQKYPEKNFIGVDLKGARIWKGAVTADKLQLKNIGFLRTIIENLDQFFEQGEVAEIWLIHPDPRPKLRDAKRRLTSPRFLNLYRQIGQSDMWVHLKTDSKLLYEYTLQVLENENISNLIHTDNLYKSPLLADHLDINQQAIKTKYENHFSEKGHTIHYIKFQLKGVSNSLNP